MDKQRKALSIRAQHVTQAEEALNEGNPKMAIAHALLALVYQSAIERVR